MNPRTEHDVRMKLADIEYLIREIVKHDISVVTPATLKTYHTRFTEWAAAAQERAREEAGE